MNDMTATILAKSDQINASDLIGAPRTITVKEVRIKAGDDQPVSILIEGDSKAFRPCKGVRRLLVRVWGPDASKYIGQSMTIFCDPKVTWAGKEEGGIRVSHMTGLSEKIVEYMRTSRAATKPYQILPLTAPKATDKEDRAAKWADGFIGEIEASRDLDELMALQNKYTERLAELKEKRAELRQRIDDAAQARASSLAGEKRAEPDMVEGFSDEKADIFD
ncbi:MAG: hypothetical protein A3E01_09035 [Gammaproteobacteria bacterium RIFCSPHIGHO2_12_FULL_63_22]|nr:MAG: hypothetical protein A3E01_09035 [Gammaproteobacteria bacterium RIFCSPHIGHO2_12_FULL_63_22]